MLAVRPFLAALLGLAVAFGLLFVIFHDRDTFHGRMDHNNGAIEDFKNFYYPAGATVMEYKRPWPGFLYPPTLAILLGPLAQLDPYDAASVWWMLTLAFTLALVAVSMALARATPWIAFLGGIIAGTSVPILHNAHWGQMSTPIVLLVFIAALLDSRGRGRAAVACIAIAGSLKFYPLLLLLVPAMRGEWKRVLEGLVFAGLLMVALPAVFLGASGMTGFYEAAFDQLGNRRNLAYQAENAGALAPHLSRSFFFQYLDPVFLRLIAVWVWVTVLVVNHRVFLDRRLGYPLCLAFLALLVEPHWPHYFVWLPFFQVVALQDRAYLRAAVSIAATNVQFFLVFPHPRDYGDLGILLLAGLIAVSGVCRSRNVAPPEETIP